jgi:hypothetical protein
MLLMFVHFGYLNRCVQLEYVNNWHASIQCECGMRNEMTEICILVVPDALQSIEDFETLAMSRCAIACVDVAHETTNICPHRITVSVIENTLLLRLVHY